MLTITIPKKELFDEQKNEFIYTKETTIALEHSLVSLSKWEAKWHKPFLTNEKKTREEIIDYVKCMTITQNVSPDVYMSLSNENIAAITKYIEDPMTATWFNEKPNNRRINREQTTSELIYYWMIALEIPFECQRWHLNRLFVLINICNIKNSSSNNKMSKNEVLSKQAALNAARRKKLGSSG